MNQIGFANKQHRTVALDLLERAGAGNSYMSPQEKLALRSTAPSEAEEVANVLNNSN